MRRSRRLIWAVILGVIALLCVLGAVGALWPPREGYCLTRFPEQHRMPVVRWGGLEHLWSQDCYMAAANSGDSRLVGVRGMVAFLGSRSAVDLDRVIAMDGPSGRRVWTAHPAYATEIDASEEALFMSTRSGILERRSPATGDIEWRNTMSPATNIFALHVEDKRVYVYSTPNEFGVFDSLSGRQLEVPTPTSLYRIYLIEPEAAFGDSIRAVNPATSEIIWDTALGAVVYETPLFLADRIIVRTGEELGSVAAVDRQTGSMLWSTERSVVSNVDLLGTGIVFLDQFGSLHMVESESGLDTIILAYEGGRVSLPSDLRGQVGGFYVAVDRSSSLLYVLLGDSGQLDAFAVEGPTKTQEALVSGVHR